MAYQHIRERKPDLIGHVERHLKLSDELRESLQDYDHCFKEFERISLGSPDQQDQVGHYIELLEGLELEILHILGRSGFTLSTMPSSSTGMDEAPDLCAQPGTTEDSSTTIEATRKDQP
jgi:hypothetical protein